MPYIVMDSAFYTKENLQKCSDTEWVTRVPETLKEALYFAGKHEGLSLIHLPVYFGPDELGGMGVFGRWNVGNWCEETQALRHEIGL